HHDEGPTVWHHAVVVDLHDVLAAQRGRSARLVLESVTGLGAVGVLALDEFHRDTGSERGVHAFPNRSHATAAEYPRKLVFSGDELAGHVEVRRRHTHRAVQA